VAGGLACFVDLASKARFRGTIFRQALEDRYQEPLNTLRNAGIASTTSLEVTSITGH
jgi:hypothetical protein